MALETARKAYPSCHQKLADYKLRIACAYLHQQNLDKARKHLDEALAMYKKNDTTDETLHHQLACCHADFGQLFLMQGEKSAAIGQLETALQYEAEKNNFEHRDTAYYCYSLLAQIHGQLLKFPAAIGLMKAAMEILPENTYHSESRVANDLQLLEYWKQIVQGNVVMLH